MADVFCLLRFLFVIQYLGMENTSKQKRHRHRIVVFVLMALIAVPIIFMLVNAIIDAFEPLQPVTFGTTFSPSYATSLGLDWKETFIASLDDLGIRRFRIPAYWEDIEPTRGTYHWSDLDWMMNEAEKRNATILLAIGYKLPRWPECHAPAWVHELPTTERQAATINLLNTIVNRYRNNSTIWGWQVENEPLFENFGNCPTPDRDFLKREVALVRALDPRPIVVTESGELSTWLRTVSVSDILGISMYRETWNRLLGYIYYPLSPGFYRARADGVRSLTKKVIVTELQAEPWVAQGIMQTPILEQMKSMNANRLNENVRFVEHAGFSEVYLWGIEWWYWLKIKQNDSSVWDAGKHVFEKTTTVQP